MEDLKTCHGYAPAPPIHRSPEKSASPSPIVPHGQRPCVRPAPPSTYCTGGEGTHSEVPCPPPLKGALAVGMRAESKLAGGRESPNAAAVQPHRAPKATAPPALPPTPGSTRGGGPRPHNRRRNTDRRLCLACSGPEPAPPSTWPPPTAPSPQEEGPSAAPRLSTLSPKRPKSWPATAPRART